MAVLAHAGAFFATARERYRIKLKREAGERWPWTQDTHFQTWSFTNVHREDDRTTTWLRENIRDPLSYKFESDHNAVKIVEAVMIFRWFNRISTGKIIQDLLLGEWNSKEAYQRLKNEDKIFTGAYIIIGKPYMSKLEGVLSAIDDARPFLPRMVPRWGDSLEAAWSDLKSINYIGGFTGYEIVMDLRYTPVLERATDVMTWGNLGPGAIRGMSWVVYGHPDGFANSVKSQKEMLGLMQEVLALSLREEYWPQAWPKWELHEVEMWMCEFAKYMRAYNGFRQKRRYQRP